MPRQYVVDGRGGDVLCVLCWEALAGLMPATTVQFPPCFAARECVTRKHEVTGSSVQRARFFFAPQEHLRERKHWREGTIRCTISAPPLWIRSTNLSAPRGTFRPCTRTIEVHEDMQHPGAGAKKEKFDGNSISGLDCARGDAYRARSSRAELRNGWEPASLGGRAKGIDEEGPVDTEPEREDGAEAEAEGAILMAGVV